jgi:hypothetical protein
MIRSTLILLVLGLTIAGARCGTVDDTDTNFLRSYGVAKPAYEKMSHHKSLSLDDIGALAQVGASDGFILDYLQTTHTIYKVSDDDLLRLWQSGLRGRSFRYLCDASDNKR